MAAARHGSPSPLALLDVLPEPACAPPAQSSRREPDPPEQHARQADHEHQLLDGVSALGITGDKTDDKTDDEHQHPAVGAKRQHEPSRMALASQSLSGERVELHRRIVRRRDPADNDG
jgi:hypothetical protein